MISGRYKTSQKRKQVDWKVVEIQRTPKSDYEDASNLKDEDLNVPNIEGVRIEVKSVGSGKRFLFTTYGPYINTDMIHDVLDFYVDKRKYLQKAG